MMNRRLDVTADVFISIMKTTIWDVVKMSLSEGQSLLEVRIMRISRLLRNGSVAGMTVDSVLFLKEKCAITCEDQ